MAYRYRKRRLPRCEGCKEEVKFLGLINGKHLCGKCEKEEKDSKNKTNPNIDNQEIDRIVRQSNHYYIYLTNGARILAQRGELKNIYYIIPAKTTGAIEKFEAKNCMDAIRQYIHLHNLTYKKGEI